MLFSHWSLFLPPVAPEAAFAALIVVKAELAFRELGGKQGSSG